MLLRRPRVDQDIVNEYLDELVQVLVEHPVHQTHEHPWGVCQSKRQNRKLVMSKSRLKGGLRDDLLLDP